MCEETSCGSDCWKHLECSASWFWTASPHLVVGEDLHDVHVDLHHPVVLGLVGEQDELDPQQRDEDQGGPHGPHVEAGLGLVGDPQLGDQNPDDVQQEEQIHLEPA